MAYFDHNATTPISAAARSAWLEAAEQFPGNPSSPHREGARAETALTQCRETLARILGCDPFDLVWTSGATESNNTVFHHLASTLPSPKKIWISAIEHPSVLEPAHHHFAARRQRRIPVTSEGIVELSWIRERLARNRPALIAIMAANNETGVLQPWRETLDLCREFDVPFFCDAAQWIGKMPAARLGECDWLSGSAHKFGGPKGVGFLKCPPGTAFTPLLLGGEQEEGRRSGTENVPGIVAMMAALAESEKLVMEQPSRLIWRDDFEARLIKRVPGSRVIGASQPRLWNTVAALMPQADCQQRWVVKLDKGGFSVSTGSACSSGKEKPSNVLRAMGASAEESGRMLRFSSGWQTTENDWNQLLDGILKVHTELGQP